MDKHVACPDLPLAEPALKKYGLINLPTCPWCLTVTCLSDLQGTPSAAPVLAFRHLCHLLERSHARLLRGRLRVGRAARPADVDYGMERREHAAGEWTILRFNWLIGWLVGGDGRSVLVRLVDWLVIWLMVNSRLILFDSSG